MSRPQILLTKEDHDRLQGLLTSRVANYVSGSERLADLRNELSRACVVSARTIPGDVVTMDSIVSFRDLDTDEVETYTLVYPANADIARGRLSVLAPVGTAILGFQVGDVVRWGVPSGWRRLRLERLIYQPERDHVDSDQDLDGQAGESLEPSESVVPA